MAVKKAVEGPLSYEGEAPVVVPFSTTLTSMCLDIHLDLELWLAFLFLLIGGIVIVVWQLKRQLKDLCHMKEKRQLWCHFPQH